MKSSELFDSLSVAQPDAIQQATYVYNKDPRPNKVPLHIGVIKDENGQDIILDSVRQAEQIVQERRKGNNSYVTSVDTKGFQEGVKRFLFDENENLLERTAVVDAYGGTNALFLLELFASKFFPDRVFISSEDGWPNHNNQITYALNKEMLTYPIADENLSYLHEPFSALVKQYPQSKLISIEQNSPHNSLGLVLDKDSWDKRLDLLKEQDGIILFDCPYAGFGNSLEEDLYPIRKAIEMGIFTMIAYSDSKLKGAYDQRIGAALIVADSTVNKEKVQSALMKIERAAQSYTSKTHLTFAELYSNAILLKLWREEFNEKLLSRVNLCKKFAVEHIEHPQAKTILERSKGLFSTFPMNRERAERLWTEDAIMLVKPEQKSVTFNNQEVVRMNVTGLGREEEAIITLKKINLALY